ncbi:4-alpha-glucanotransferase [Azotobacter vinelandii]|uniref:4-alpha-glucanotransferase n=1 Tax=Azotobacter vinelandii TaxID=354 RepID=UPI0026658EDB|nr:4-alpha-glucanotransferase [Azotobacter vinelandii]WKN24332.1 4-alpha-glucanotransferase [Azotobacter vinelandii]
MSNDERLRTLAAAAGIAVDWIDAEGRPRKVTPEVLRRVLAELELPADSGGQIADSLEQLRRMSGELPPLLTLERGQYLDLSGHFEPGSTFELTLEDGRRHSGRLDEQARLPPIEQPGHHRLAIGAQSLTLAVAPPRCTGLDALSGHPSPRLWGLAVQLYSLRRQGDGGIGDTQALENLVHRAAREGAAGIAISPLHAMFSADTQRFSPYSPSSRLFYNVLHSAPGSILGEREVRTALEAGGLADEWQRLERLELIDWPAAADAKLRLLRLLHAEFRQGGNPLEQDFASFRRNGGEALDNHCRFEALHAYHVRHHGLYDWRCWDPALRCPGSAAVAGFAREYEDEITFHAFAQWLIVRGLERTQQAARSAGMPIGLIADLAVGADGGGSQAWSRQAELLPSLTVGAPPDILNRSGQSWGVSAFSPWGLRQHGFHAFIEMLRANLAHAGGIRIDHVMGLRRLWLIPPGAEQRDGAYLHYPQEDLMRLLALESWRHGAAILGEDLGTVPEGFRPLLAERGILGMRVLLFEQDDDGRFARPRQWPGDALATSTTHDLPTLAGWWRERDIDWRERLRLTDAEASEAARRTRRRERLALREALADSGGPALDEPLDSDGLIDACVRFLGATPAPLVLLPMEDALGLDEQANLPGTIDGHPNWRRRLPVESDGLLDDAAPARRLCLLKEARGTPGGRS